jgi:hypothetical protein
MKLFRFCLLSFSLMFSSLVMGQSTYDLIVNGTKCTMNRNQMDCNYTIGSDFWLSIAGVGGVDTGITFMKSDFKGKYYGTVGIMHGCIIVKNGVANTKSSIGNMAFVSPKNGKVYQDWQSCGETR